MIRKIILLCGILLAGTSQAAVINKEEIALNNVINSLINEDYEVFKNGGKTALSYDVPEKHRDIDIVRDYENNEIYANKKYLGKNIRVTGRALEIRSGLDGLGIIELSNRTRGSGVQLKVGADSEYVLGLSRGDLVDMICVGDKYLMNTPILKNCTPTIDTVKQVYQYTSNQPKFRATAYVILKIYDQQLMPACVSGEDECLKKLKSIMDADNSKFTNETLQYINSHKSELEDKFGKIFD
ncbi:hypothetical protein M0K80_RS16725 [Providencia rettgeri]|nr:hypothetical protein [Providencia rettgeri]